MKRRSGPKKVGDLDPAPYNPRTIADEQLERLGRSMQEFGDLSGIVFNRRTGRLIGGHQRIKHLGPGTAIEVTEELGEPNDQGTVALGHVDHDGERWTYREVDVDEFTEALMNLAANRHGGDWDLPKLQDVIAGLDGQGADLGLSGFDDREIEELLAAGGPDVPEDPGADIDRAAELREKWGTERGRVWVIPSKALPGRSHRLMCGDSTSEEDTNRLLEGGTPRIMVTDPPYGVEYDANWRNEEAEKGNLAWAATRRVRAVQADDRVDWSAAWALFPGAVVYCWRAAWHAADVQRSLESSGFDIRSQIIWAKSHFPISRGHYHWRHEPCWYAVRAGEAAGWVGDRKQTTLWDDIHLDRNVEGDTLHRSP